jgi:competence protein ComGC
MKTTFQKRPAAFNLVELLFVLLVVSLLLSLFPVSFANSKLKAQRITCVNNLRQIGTAYRLWEQDNNGLLPFQQSVSKGGWSDLLTNADTGAIVWTNYLLMSNELGPSPKLVNCPADDRETATDFGTNFRDNSHLSYFVGVNASDLYPQSFLGGDRNLGPGTTPDPDYGYSPKSGKGNDVTIPISSPLSWSLKMHSSGNTVGAGNILIGDGSCQQMSSSALNQNWLPTATGTNNWPAGHIPATPSIRLVFP